jgi:DNA polymerase-1
MKRVFLVDGSGLVYRAFFALLRNPLVTSRGENVSAIHGFLTTLLRLLREENPDEIGVAFDVRGATFRHDIYPQYKATRPPMPPELGVQIPRAKELLDAMGVVRCEVEGMEADDVIASLARRAVSEGNEAIIVSADKDFMQLIGPSVRQWIPPKLQEPGQWVDQSGVVERWGVRPDQMVDLLSLMGDASDNIPGVAGVGAKTAASLLQKHGSLDEVYQRLAEIPQKGLRAKLEQSRDSAFLSRDLVQIRAEIPQESLPAAMPVPDLTHRPEFLAQLEKLEFRRIIESLGLREAKRWETEYRMVSTPEELADLLRRWRESARPLAIAVEPAEKEGPILGIALGWSAGQCWYIPIAHEIGPNISADAVREQLAPILADPAFELTGHDLKEALHRLRRFGLPIRAALRDVVLSSYLLDPEGRHDLPTLCGEMLGHVLIPEEDVLGSGKHRLTYQELDSPAALEPVAEKADVTIRLREEMEPKLRDQELLSIWTDLESPLVSVLARMEEIGIALDVPFLSALSGQFESRLARLTSEIHRLAGVEFNIASPTQLGEVLFDTLKLPKRKRTKTGYSTDHEVLEALAERHPVPKLVLEHRALSKLKGTYVDALPLLVDPVDGRIHATFHQAVAATGRLSSSDPNIQNIPIRNEEGREIRKAFIAPPGRVLISADYSQVELRILAHLSRDPGLAEGFKAGHDVHTSTAARLFGVPPEQVGIELRSRAKAINFGVIYGMGPQRISREMGVSMTEARSFIEDYFAKMPGVRTYLEENLAFARKHGYVRTILGRRRILRGINSPDPPVRAQAERVCANTPIQGSAADVIKRAMLEVDRELAASGTGAHLLLQVHDELVVEAPASKADEVVALVRRCMEEALELSVPLHVEAGVGATWEEAHR